MSKKITILGDSTIDNKIWIAPGPVKTAILDHLHLNGVVRKLKSLSKNSELSVVQNLKKMLPNYRIHDYSNDGFTTSDVLNGQFMDKVFPPQEIPILGNITLDNITPFPATFPHKFFAPLNDDAIKKNIKESQHIILSVGGNNVREFLQSNNLKEGFPKLLEKLKSEYIEIVTKLRSMNKDAQIILLTQYYPSHVQNDYNIYEFLQKVGEALDLGGPDHDAQEVIYEITKQVYSEVFSTISTDNIVVADITSSLNLFEPYNHSHQIEPSGIGGRKIAKMLSYLVNDNPASGIYRFEPGFFRGTNNSDENVVKSEFTNWDPKSPKDFVNENKEINDLFEELTRLENQYQFTSPKLSIACKEVGVEGKRLLNKLSNDDEFYDLKKSIQLSIDVLKKPDSDQIITLRDHASKMRGKRNGWHQFTGALMSFVGASIITLGIIGIPFTGGLSSVGCYAGGSLIATSGFGLFMHGRQKGLSRSLSSLANVVEKESHTANIENKQRAVSLLKAS